MTSVVKTELSTLSISPTIGDISLAIATSSQPQAVMTLAHGAGTNMHHSFLEDLATQLGQAGLATVRFNFAYTEKGKKMPDRFPVASTIIERVMLHTQTLFSGVPLFVSGKSFGGRMTSMTLAANPMEFVKGIIFYGFPLHPANTPSVERAKHLGQIDLPLLFLQGTRDTLATHELIVDVTKSLSTATLINLEGYDHGFKRGKHIATDALVAETVSWIARHR